MWCMYFNYALEITFNEVNKLLLIGYNSQIIRKHSGWRMVVGEMCFIIFCFDPGVQHLGRIRNHSEHSCLRATTPYLSSLQTHSSSKKEDKTSRQELHGEQWHRTSLRCSLCALPQPYCYRRDMAKTEARWSIKSYSLGLKYCPVMSRVDLPAQWEYHSWDGEC